MRIETRAERVRSGEIVVSPATSHCPRKVSSGLIHDWIGAVFIPDAAIGDVLAVLRDYGKYPEFYPPIVRKSTTLSRGEYEDRLRFC